MKSRRTTAPHRRNGLALVAILGVCALATTACGEEAPETVAVGADEGAGAAGGTQGSGGGETDPEPPAGVEPEPEPPAGGEGEPEPPTGGIQMHEFCESVVAADLQDPDSLRELRNAAPAELQDDVDVLIEQAEVQEQDPLNMDFDAFSDATMEISNWEFDNCLIIE